jgi:hypothetical protein
MSKTRKREIVLASVSRKTSLDIRLSHSDHSVVNELYKKLREAWISDKILEFRSSIQGLLSPPNHSRLRGVESEVK